MQLTHPNRHRSQRPTVTPLEGEDELQARRILVEAFLAAFDHVDSWAGAERLALDVLDNLKGEGIELLRVRWS
jgi:hypothetical protein